VGEDELPPSESDAPLVERWSDVVDHDVHRVLSWVAQEVGARAGERVQLTVRGLTRFGEPRPQSAAVDGRRGQESIDTASRVLAGLLEDLPHPFAGVLLVSVRSQRETKGAEACVPILVGPQDRLRRAPGVRELMQRVAWLAERNREMDRANLSLVKSAPLLLMSAAEVIAATRGVNLAMPWTPSNASSPTAQLVADFVRDVVMPRWSPGRTTNPWPDAAGTSDGSPRETEPSDGPSDEPSEPDAGDSADWEEPLEGLRQDGRSWRMVEDEGEHGSDAALGGDEVEADRPAPATPDGPPDLWHEHLGFAPTDEPA
jgi:hypothetical protein